MQQTTPDELLDGPRFRTLCLAVAARLDAGVDRAVGALLDPLTTSYGLLADLRPEQDAADALAAVLSSVDTRQLAAWTHPLRFLPVLEHTVESAMPWQPPFVEDAITGLPAVRNALRTVAEAVVASPSAAWWGTDVDRTAQWVTQPVRNGVPEVVASARSVAEVLDRWRRYVVAGEGRSRVDGPVADATGGVWWSTPHEFGDEPGGAAILPSSTRRIDGLGSSGSTLVEDSFGDDEVLLRSLQPPAGARVFEVHGAADWARLVERYPMSVRWARRREWWESTGRDEHWFLPDYAAVAADHDAVHVSVQGYLAAAGRAIDVDGGATVLAGWAPDETFWLTDDIVIEPDAERWQLRSAEDEDEDDEPRWVRT